LWQKKGALTKSNVPSGIQGKGCKKHRRGGKKYRSRRMLKKGTRSEKRAFWRGRNQNKKSPRRRFEKKKRTCSHGKWDNDRTTGGGQIEAKLIGDRLFCFEKKELPLPGSEKKGKGANASMSRKKKITQEGNREKIGDLCS